MGKVWVPISQAFPRVLLHFLVLWEIDGETHAFLICWSIPQDGNLMEKSTYGKNMGTNFPGFVHLVVFAEFSNAIGNRLENPYISHVMKSTIGLESNSKKAPILWEKYDYQFRRSSPYDGFCCIFPYYGKLIGKPMHFPYDEIYHRMGIRWEKSTHTTGKVWLTISKAFSIRWVLLHFPVLWEIDGKTHAFPIWWNIP